jgi:hypothetical protein
MICWPSSAPSDDFLAAKEVEPIRVKDLHKPSLHPAPVRRIFSARSPDLTRALRRRDRRRGAASPLVAWLSAMSRHLARCRANVSEALHCYCTRSAGLREESRSRRRALAQASSRHGTRHNDARARALEKKTVRGRSHPDGIGRNRISQRGSAPSGSPSAAISAGR